MDIGKEIKETMKEAIIEFLKGIDADDADKDKVNNIINFLQRGWKYEEMWGEFFGMIHPDQMKQLFSIKSIFFPGDLNHYSLTTLRKIKCNLEQKHFPRVVK